MPTKFFNLIYRYLVEHGSIRAIRGFGPENLRIYSDDVLERIRSGDPSWQGMVPSQVAQAIQSRKLLGYSG